MPPSADAVILDTLKDVHNRGAALYNGGEHAAAFRLYQGALLVARPLLAHRPATQKAVADGLAEVEVSAADAKLKAFRLHEVMEQVRADIKADGRAARPAGATAAGTLLVAGRPAPDVCVLFFPRGAVAPAGLAVSDGDGRFALGTPLPPGRYTLTLVGPAVPAVYQQVSTTPLQIDLKTGPNAADVAAP
jgi:hypothetical protein